MCTGKENRNHKTTACTEGLVCQACRWTPEFVSLRFTEQAAVRPGKAKWAPSPKQEADDGALTLNRGAAAYLTGAHVVARCGSSSGRAVLSVLLSFLGRLP